MNLLDIVSPDCIRSPLAGTTKRAIIDELVDALALAGKVADADLLKAAVWQREQTRTTGIGRGLAIPHGKCAGMAGIAMAIGKPAAPMDFDAIDGKPVRLVVLLASPPDKTSDHIQALAKITRLMSVDAFAEQIYSTQTPSEIYALLQSKEA